MDQQRTVAAPETPPGAAAVPRRGLRLLRRSKLLGFVSGVVLAVAVTAAVLWPHSSSARGAGTPAKAVPVAWGRPAVSASGLAQRSGVVITQLAVTGQGGLVDLRYKVLDPDKAAALHNKKTPPALVDEQSGLVVHDLFMDHSHSGPYKAGITYYLVFNNPGNWVHRGSRVSVLLGDAQVEHVLVR